MEAFEERIEQVEEILDRLRQEELEQDTVEALREQAEAALADARELLDTADGKTYLVTGDDDSAVEPFEP